MHFGIDISSNNTHPIDYGAVVAYLRELGGGEQPFVIVKATEGTGYINPDFHGDVLGFRNAGAAVGAYLMDHGSSNVATEEGVFKRVAGSLPQFDDDEIPDGMSNSAYAQHCAQLLAQNPVAVDYLNQSEENSGFPEGDGDWEANYNKQPGVVHSPKALIHQYDDQGVIPGAQGYFDMNAWLGTEDQFAKMFAETPVPAQAPEPQPQPVVSPAHRNTFTPLAVDGSFGPHTIAAQQFVDFNGDRNSCDGVFGPASKRAMQAHLGVKVDGAVGPVTVRALQKHVGAVEDGDWGKQTTSSLQRALNEGRY